MKKIIALITALSFLLSSVSSAAEVNFNKTSQSAINLAPPILLDDITDGTHHKNISLADIALQMDLRELDKISDIDGATDLITIKDAFQRKERFSRERTYHEDTIFKPAKIETFFNEAEHIGKRGISHIFTVKVDVTKNGRTEHYKLLFSTIRNKDGAFPTVLCTKEQLEAVRVAVTRTGVLPQRSEKDSNAIGNYIQHEEDIDKFLSELHKKGFVKSSDIIGNDTRPGFVHFNYHDMITELIAKLNLKVDNPHNLLAIEDRQFNLIPLTSRIPNLIRRLAECAVELEALDGSKAKVIPYYHESNYAVHGFMYEEDINALYVGDKKAEDVKKKMEGILAHSLGAMLGRPILFFDETGRPINDIDVRYERMLHNEDLAGKPALECSIANLDHVVGRDYAAAMANKPVQLEKVHISAIPQIVFSNLYIDRSKASRAMRDPLGRLLLVYGIKENRESGLGKQMGLAVVDSKNNVLVHGEVYNNYMLDPAFSPSGRFMVTVADFNRVGIYDLESRKLIAIRDLEFSVDRCEFDGERTVTFIGGKNRREAYNLATGAKVTESVEYQVTLREGESRLLEDGLELKVSQVIWRDSEDGYRVYNADGPRPTDTVARLVIEDTSPLGHLNTGIGMPPKLFMPGEIGKTDDERFTVRAIMIDPKTKTVKIEVRAPKGSRGIAGEEEVKAKQTAAGDLAASVQIFPRNKELEKDGGITDKQRPSARTLAEQALGRASVPAGNAAGQGTSAEITRSIMEINPDPIIGKLFKSRGGDDRLAQYKRTGFLRLSIEEHDSLLNLIRPLIRALDRVQDINVLKDAVADVKAYKGREETIQRKALYDLYESIINERMAGFNRDIAHRAWISKSLAASAAPRDPVTGQFAQVSGKSPDDALTVIANSPNLQQGSFSLAEYAKSYAAYSQMRVIRGLPPFEPLATNWQTTARSDLGELINRGILEPRPAGAEGSKNKLVHLTLYRLTEKGRTAVSAIMQSAPAGEAPGPIAATLIKVLEAQGRGDIAKAVGSRDLAFEVARIANLASDDSELWEKQGEVILTALLVGVRDVGDLKARLAKYGVQEDAIGEERAVQATAGEATGELGENVVRPGIVARLILLMSAGGRGKSSEYFIKLSEMLKDQNLALTQTEKILIRMALIYNKRGYVQYLADLHNMITSGELSRCDEILARIGVVAGGKGVKEQYTALNDMSENEHLELTPTERILTYVGIMYSGYGAGHHRQHLDEMITHRIPSFREGLLARLGMILENVNGANPHLLWMTDHLADMTSNDMAIACVGFIAAGGAIESEPWKAIIAQSETTEPETKTTSAMAQHRLTQRIDAALKAVRTNKVYASEREREIRQKFAEFLMWLKGVVEKRPDMILDKPLSIGAFTETKQGERRTGLIPDVVWLARLLGIDSFVQRDTGVTGDANGSKFSDSQYENSGAVMCGSAEEIFRKAAIFEHIKELQGAPNDENALLEQIVAEQGEKIVFNFNHFAEDVDRLIRALETRAAYVSFENIVTMNKDGRKIKPILAGPSEKAGVNAAYEMARYLKTWNKEVSPSERAQLTAELARAFKEYDETNIPIVPDIDLTGFNLVVYGGGVVGYNQARILAKMGANVTIIELRDARIKELKTLFAKEGLTNVQFVNSSEKTKVEAVLKAAHGFSTTAYEHGQKAQKLVTEAMLREMGPGKIITVVDIDQGGGVEGVRATSHKEPTYEYYGSLVYSVPNMPGAIPRQTSIDVSLAAMQYLITMSIFGLENAATILPEMGYAVDGANGRIANPIIEKELGDKLTEKLGDKADDYRLMTDAGKMTPLEMRLAKAREVTDKAWRDIQDQARAENAVGVLTSPEDDAHESAWDNHRFNHQPFEDKEAMAPIFEEASAETGLPTNSLRDEFTRMREAAVLAGSTEPELHTFLEEKAIGARRARAREALASIPKIAETRREDSNKYNLLLPFEFFANGDFDAHQSKYLHRFNLDRVGQSVSSKDFVDNVLAKMRPGEASRTIALVPNTTEEADLDRLVEAGVRFISIGFSDLMSIKGLEKDTRARFQEHTYAEMLLFRMLGQSADTDAAILGMLRYYLTSHFDLEEGVDPDSYMRALKTFTKEDVLIIIKGCISLRKFLKYDAIEEHRSISAPLIFA